MGDEIETETYVTRQVLAETLGISGSSVRQYMLEGLPYVSKPGAANQFPLAKALEWVRIHKPNSKGNSNIDNKVVDNTVATPSGGDDDRLEEAKIADLLEATALKKQKRLIVGAKYVSRKAIHAELLDGCAFISQHMRQIADHQDIPEDSREAVRRVVDSGLSEFSEMLSGAAKRVASRQRDKYIRKAVQE